ncbi:hypothetical protein K493DRAFT_308128 [Basidiobolus meristosporus CBS 931.73]|uniref:Uncharacterized protein n=1 Tax=Basidiobolus meristosporus CBS 931.73 TaxID=1314790 RepID=A0A1Y1X631_9FUNG|nr:hypothetical protein K493DRAFT_308128 [Basidiobolus meristosporus CBS 931.73]|eukprot:ORX81259.1 hypothetical protein K493DRAFT_308128 [Basidiobolus meristosporus CBS 931.73]
MDYLSLERVITLGDSKLTHLYESNRDLGIAKEVVLKDFLRKARQINDFQKQIPLNLSPSKEIFDNYFYDDGLARSPMDASCNGSAYNELILSIMNTYMYPTATEYAVSSNVSTGYVNYSWPNETASEFSYSLATESDCYSSELISTPQTAVTSDQPNYAFEQPSYYNYLASTNSETLELNERCQTNSENISQDIQVESSENPHPFYSELSKALLLNEASSEAQALVSGDKRKRCYEEADIEAQLLQAKRVATV